MGTDARNTLGYGVVVVVVLGLVGLGWFQMTHPGKGKQGIPAPTATNNSIMRLKNAYYSKDGNPASGFSLKNKAASDE